MILLFLTFIVMIFISSVINIFEWPENDIHHRANVISGINGPSQRLLERFYGAADAESLANAREKHHLCFGTIINAFWCAARRPHAARRPPAPVDASTRCRRAAARIRGSNGGGGHRMAPAARRWSFVSMTTVGYGDCTPISTAGRIYPHCAAPAPLPSHAPKPWWRGSREAAGGPRAVDSRS